MSRRYVHIYSPLMTATSIGRRNTCIKSFRRRFKFQRLSWSLIELTSYFK